MSDTKDTVALALDLAEHLALDVCGNGHPPGYGCSACDVWHAIDTAGLVDAQEQIARLRSALEKLAEEREACGECGNPRRYHIDCHGTEPHCLNIDGGPSTSRYRRRVDPIIDAALAPRKEV